MNRDWSKSAGYVNTRPNNYLQTFCPKQHYHWLDEDPIRNDGKIKWFNWRKLLSIYISFVNNIYNIQVNYRCRLLETFKARREFVKSLKKAKRLYLEFLCFFFKFGFAGTTLSYPSFSLFHNFQINSQVNTSRIVYIISFLFNIHLRDLSFRKKKKFKVSQQLWPITRINLVWWKDM